MQKETPKMENIMNYYPDHMRALVPPGWGIKQDMFSRGFTKAFRCFGRSFVSVHTTTLQLKKDIEND